MKKFIIEKFSHGFHVFVPYASDRQVVFNFCRELTEYEKVWNKRARRKIEVPKKTYACANPNKDTFGFVLGEFPKFLRQLQMAGYKEHDYEIRENHPDAGVPIDFELPGITPREGQVSALKFMDEPGKRIRVLPLPTGQGKTLTTLLYLAQRKERTVIFGQAVHIPTWVKSIMENTNLTKKDILVISGSKSMHALINLGLSGNIREKIILISSTTFNNYLKTFLHGAMEEDREYDVTPDKFFSTIGAGVSVTDECHEALHQVVRRAIMTNVPLQIYLSATLDPSRMMIKRLYEIVFPLKDRFRDFKNNAHIDVKSYRYHAHDPNKIKCIGAMGYSHNEFEKSIFKNREMTENYLSMIYNIIEEEYLANRKEGMKMLVFASMVDSCVIIADYLKEKLSDDMSVSIFTAAEPETVLEDFEIIVTTPKSCGTGKDIPNLYMSIMTPAIASKQLSQQILGRTRPIKLYPDIDPKFYYLSCMNIPKHVEYDIGHLKDFVDKSKSVEVLDSVHWV